MSLRNVLWFQLNKSKDIPNSKKSQKIFLTCQIYRSVTGTDNPFR